MVRNEAVLCQEVIDGIYVVFERLLLLVSVIDPWLNIEGCYWFLILLELQVRQKLLLNGLYQVLYLLKVMIGSLCLDCFNLLSKTFVLLQLELQLSLQV